jgi:hypothetical protein
MKLTDLKYGRQNRATKRASGLRVKPSGALNNPASFGKVNATKLAGNKPPHGGQWSVVSDQWSEKFAVNHLGG